jgi:hydroxyacylglutathione hydrolase
MKIQPLQSQVSDNVFYLLFDETSKEALLIDPVDAFQAIRAIREQNLRLSYVINTHFHHDHSGGNIEVLNAFPEAQLVAGIKDVFRIEEGGQGVSVNLPLKGDDTLMIGKSILTAIETPGHTAGHLSFMMEEALFCGDTIFIAGAGNCRHGGDPATLYQTFSQVFSKLPGNLRLYPGHDYAINNLHFTLSIEPENQKAKELLKKAEASKETVFTTTLEDEKSYNLFFRSDDPTLLERVEKEQSSVLKEQRDLALSEPEALFRSIRELRNRW